MFGKKKSEGFKIIIVGCGKVGTTLVSQLTREGHDITIIDKDQSIVNDVTGTYDVMGVAGNGASFTVLQDAGISDADLLIAVTDSDELNLLCCTLAKQFGNLSAIARVRTPDYSKETNYLRQKLGLAMIINPELEAALEASAILALPNALEVNSFAHGQATLVKFRLPEDNDLVGRTIASIGSSLKSNITFCAIERKGEVYIPSGAFTLEADDVISYVSNRRNASNFLTEIGYKSNKVKDAMIIGGGKGAYYLAEQLISMGIKVKIIETDKARCEELSLLLPKAIIINGDGIDQELLKAEGIQSAESFIPLTGIDEVNVLLTLHAKNVSDAKVITKINKINYNEVLDKLDLGSVIYPKFITSEAIVAYVRARQNSGKSSNIETLYHMFDSRIEAIEFKVDAASAVTGVPLKDLKRKDDVLVAFINRKGRIIIPKGTDSIEKGDTVMIVTKNTGFTDIQDILA
ncbi:MAG: Trk system potassium transporter TrkA [Lachnospiraceae bacterium]|nr:Trk system potassium transporter TrkA [Lachnospiraceae bacterium]